MYLIQNTRLMPSRIFDITPGIHVFRNSDPRDSWTWICIKIRWLLNNPRSHVLVNDTDSVRLEKHATCRLAVFMNPSLSPGSSHTVIWRLVSFGSGQRTRRWRVREGRRVCVRVFRRSSMHPLCRSVPTQRRTIVCCRAERVCPRACRCLWTAME